MVAALGDHYGRQAVHGHSDDDLALLAVTVVNLTSTLFGSMSATVAASNVTPCLRTFASDLTVSHSKLPKTASDMRLACHTMHMSSTAWLERSTAHVDLRNPYPEQPMR